MSAYGTPIFYYEPGMVIPGESFVRASLATYYDSNGIVRTAPANVKRDGHYRLGEKTLLIEDAATNVATWSEDLTHWSLNAAASIIIADATIAPDGNQTADQVVDNPANANSPWILTQAAIGTGQWTFSTWIKRNAGTIFITVWDNVSGFQELNVTPLLPIGVWTRVSVTRTVNVASTLQGWGIGQSTSADRDFYMWGMQMEAGANMTSYIKTAAATASRLADQYSVPFPATPEPMTVYMKEYDLGTLGSATSRRWFQIGDVLNGNPRLIVLGSGGTFRVQYQTSLATVIADQTPTIPFDSAVEFAMHLFSDGALDTELVLAAGRKTISTRSGPIAFESWASPGVLQIGHIGNSSAIFGAITKIAILPGNMPLEDMRGVGPGGLASAGFTGGWLLAERGHVAPPAPPKPKVRKPSQAELHAARVAREFAARQAELKAAEDRRIENARKLWGASETTQPTFVRIPKAVKTSQGPKILRLPRSK